MARPRPQLLALSYARPRSGPGRSASRFLVRPYTLLLLLLALPTVAFLFFSHRQLDGGRGARLQTEPSSNTTSSSSDETSRGSNAEGHGHLWSSPAYGYRPCIEPSGKHQAAQETSRYLTIRSNGGLNQMRTGISDMVAIARIMNATLVIPTLDKKSFWKDSSAFSDIFDEDYFIKYLERDIKIVKELPKELESQPRARKHFSSWGSMGYYQEMGDLWKEYQVIHVPKTDSRLANNDLPLDIQRLRCRALYQALRFSAPIVSLAQVLSLHHADATEASGASKATWEIYCSSFEI